MSVRDGGLGDEAWFEESEAFMGGQDIPIWHTTFSFVYEFIKDTACQHGDTIS